MAESTAFILELIAVVALTALLFNRYASWKRTPVHVIVTVLIGWLLSFSIIILLPVDIASTLTKRCEKEDKDCSESTVTIIGMHSVNRL